MTRGEYKTMAEAVERLRGHGFTSDFTVANEGGVSLRETEPLKAMT
jgi:hypothetical protein